MASKGQKHFLGLLPLLAYFPAPSPPGRCPGLCAFWTFWPFPQQEVYNVTGPSEMLMMYAQWEPDNYSITYVNAVNGTDYIVNTNPTSYTYITGTINLTAPTKFGYEFVGWTWEGQTTPTKSAAISQGSTGNKTFTAHWARATALELTQDIGGYTMVDGQIITGSGGANTHITIADGATVTLNGVDIRSIVDDTDHSWAGITCLGSATIILGLPGSSVTLYGLSFSQIFCHFASILSGSYLSIAILYHIFRGN